MSMEVWFLLLSVIMVIQYGGCIVSTRYSFQALTELPAGIPTDTTNLQLGYNSISVFDADKLSLVVALEVLNMPYNSLTQFPNLTYARNTLTEVDFSDNSISYIHPDLLNILSVIETIDLERNSLDTFPNVAGPSGSLTELVMSSNLFTVFPLMDLTGTSLRKLAMDYNSITEVSKNDLKGLDSIREIRLAGNQITAFPDLSHVVDTLSAIRLEFNGINKVAAERFVFPDIQNRSLALILYDNNIVTVPPPGGYFNNIVLDLARNPLQCDGMLSWMLEVGPVDMLFDRYNDDPGDDFTNYDYNVLNYVYVMSPLSLSWTSLTDLTNEDLGIAAEIPADVRQTETYSEAVRQNYYNNLFPLSTADRVSRIECHTLCQPLKGCTYYNMKCSGSGRSCECHYNDPLYGQTRDALTGGTDGWTYYYISQHTVIRN